MATIKATYAIEIQAIRTKYELLSIFPMLILLLTFTILGPHQPPPKVQTLS